MTMVAKSSLRFLIGALTLIMVCGVAAGAQAQCASVSVTPVGVTYDPASVLGGSNTFTVTVTNNGCGANASIAYGVANGMIDATGAVGARLAGLPVTYGLQLTQGVDQLFLDSGSAQKIERSASLNEGETDSTTFTVLIPAGSKAPYNQLQPPFLAYARAGTQVTNSEQTIQLNLVSSFSMTLAGGGIATTLDFGTLSANAQRSINVVARAPQPFQVHLTSQNNGAMALVGAPSNTPWRLPYSATLGGAPISLSTPYADARAAGTTADPGGQTTLPFVVTLGDPASLRAGIYRDVITLTVWPTP